MKRILVQLLNPFIALSGRVLNESAFKALLKMDFFLSNKLNTYRQLVFIIAKDPSCLTMQNPPGVDIDSILDFKVPLYALK